MSKKETREKLLKAIKDVGEDAYTKSIAEEAGISVTTTSKYLDVLEAEKIIYRKEKRPFVYWFIKNKKGDKD